MPGQPKLFGWRVVGCCLHIKKQTTTTTPTHTHTMCWVGGVCGLCVAVCCGNLSLETVVRLLSPSGP